MNKPFDFPPPLNNSLAEWLSSKEPGLDVPILYEICRYMHSQFTQFNEKSNLKVVGEKLIVNKYLHSQYGQTVMRPFKKPAPGLRGKFARFWTKVMPGSYWEALRERFPDLQRRRWDGYDYGSVADPDAQFTRAVELKYVGFHQVVDPLLMSHQRDTTIPRFNGDFEFMAGYEPLTDTLYLHERTWIRRETPYGRVLTK